MSYYDCYSQCNKLRGKVFSGAALYQKCIGECSEPDQELFATPMLWIGFYIATASLVCMLAMGTDLINGIRRKKSWFPCKFFTLNAATSALLAIALKMSVDLTTFMPCGRDQLMKLTATALFSVSMGNFMPSLADMSDPELLANFTALILFIVPLISNIFIQIGTGIIYRGVAIQHIVIILFILIQFASLVSTAIASPDMKQKLQDAYNRKSKSVEGNLDRELKKHWVMAETSSPQFVMARSVLCTSSGAVCVLTLLVLIEAIIQLYVTLDFVFFVPSSDYLWSANFIVVVQLVAVFVGSMSPICRWFTVTVLWLKFEEWPTTIQKFLKVEDYWTNRLKELRVSHLGLGWDSNYFIRKGKSLGLEVLIKFQKFSVLSCKLLCLVSILYLFPYMIVYKIIIIFKDKDHEIHSEPSNNWVLKLPEEPDLPKSIIEKIISDFDNYFKKWTEKANSQNQINPPEKSDGFDLKLIEGFYNNQNGCWVKRIVTLSTIICAINTSWDKKFASHVKCDILPIVIYVEKAIAGALGSGGGGGACALGVGGGASASGGGGDDGGGSGGNGALGGGAGDSGAGDKTNIDPWCLATIIWSRVHRSKKWLNTQLSIKNPNLDMNDENALSTILETLKNSSPPKKQRECDKILSNKMTEWMEETIDIVNKNKGINSLKILNQIISYIKVLCLENLEKAITANISNASIEKRELVVKEAIYIYGKALKIQKEGRVKLMTKTPP